MKQLIIGNILQEGNNLTEKNTLRQYKKLNANYTKSML